MTTTHLFRLRLDPPDTDPRLAVATCRCAWATFAPVGPGASTHILTGITRHRAAKERA